MLSGSEVVKGGSVTFQAFALCKCPFTTFFVQAVNAFGQVWENVIHVHCMPVILNLCTLRSNKVPYPFFVPQNISSWSRLTTLSYFYVCLNFLTSLQMPQNM